MSVFTVFFCGTGADSLNLTGNNPNYPDGELVARTAYYHSRVASEYAEWIIVDGPGSGSSARGNQVVKPSYWEDQLWGISGKLMGTGWEQNVKHAAMIIKGVPEKWERVPLDAQQYQTLIRLNQSHEEQLKDLDATTIYDVERDVEEFTPDGGSIGWKTVYDLPTKPSVQAIIEAIVKIKRKSVQITKVNMLGWSRGGVSCFMLANALAQDPATKNIEVRIIAVDPVPGYGNTARLFGFLEQTSRTRLSNNVKELVLFYAQDERSFGFNSLIPYCSIDPVIIPMRGRHATLVGNPSDDGNDVKAGKSLQAPGKIVRHITESYLTKWGTKLESGKQLNLTPQKMKDLYGEIVRNKDRYDKLHTFSYTGKLDGTGPERYVMVAPNDLYTPKTFTNAHPKLKPTETGFLSWHHELVVSKGQIMPS